MCGLLRATRSAIDVKLPKVNTDQGMYWHSHLWPSDRNRSLYLSYFVSELLYKAIAWTWNFLLLSW